MSRIVPSGDSPSFPSRAVLWTLLVTSTLTVMAGAIIAPSLPVMREVFRDVARVEMGVRLVLTMPALFIILGAPVAGWLADRHGRRRLLVAATLLFAGAGGAGLVLSTLTGLLVSRAMLGLAVAGLMTSVTTLIGDYYGGMERARVLGAQAAFMGLGGVVYTIGGGLLAALHWRGPFGVYLVALVLLPAILKLLHEPDAEEEETSAGSGSEGAPVVRSSPAQGSIPLGVAGPVFAVVFLLQVVFYTIPVQLPFHLQALGGHGPRTAGLAIAVCSLFFSLGSFYSARLNQGWSHAAVVARGLLFAAAGFGLVAVAPGLPVLFPGLALAGAGIGIILPSMSVWLNSEVPAAVRGRAMGGLTTAVFLGQFVSPIVTQPLIAAGGAAAAYRGIAIGLPVIAAAAFVGGRDSRADG